MENAPFAIAGWIRPEDILLDVDVRDGRHALELIASAIGRTHGIDPASIARALERREQVGSTALGDGFAIPHARIAGIDRPLTLFMRTRTGIDFRASDAKPVSDLLAILVPASGEKQDHLQLLALICQLFSDKGFRAQLDGAEDAATAAGLFRGGVLRVCGPRP